MRNAALLTLAVFAAGAVAVFLNLVLLGLATAQDDPVGRLAPSGSVAPAAPAWTLRPATGRVEDLGADD